MQHIPTKSLATGLTLLSAALLLIACNDGGDDPEPAQPTTQSVSLEFAAVAGGTPVACGTQIEGLGTGNVAAQLKDFRFYVTDAALVRADGVEVPITLGANDAWNHTNADGSAKVTMIDLENATGSCASGTAATNAVLTGTVPTADYVGVKLTVGVPEKLNHLQTSAAPPPLDLLAMNWSWTSGYKFAKIEVTDPDPLGAAGSTPWSTNTFNVHLGSTNCTGDVAAGTFNCTVPNRMAITLNNFNAQTQKIAIDVKAMLAGSDVTANGTALGGELRSGSPGCMSSSQDPDCPAVFQAMQIGLAAPQNAVGTADQAGMMINGGAAQTIFKVISK